MRQTLDNIWMHLCLHVIKISDPFQLEACHRPSSPAFHTVKRILSMSQLPEHLQEHGVESLIKPLIPPLIRSKSENILLSTLTKILPHCCFHPLMLLLPL